MDEDYFLNAEIPQWNGLNCNAEQSFLNPNSSIDHYSHFESAFSSMVSSPAASTAFRAAAATSVAASRYVGDNNGHTNDSCCSSTLSSPSKLHLLHIDQIKMANWGNSVPLVTPLPPFDVDPGFPVRDSKLSCFGRRFNGRATPLRLKNGEFSRRLSTPLMGTGKLPPVLSSPSINQHGSPVENKNLSQAQKEMSSVNGGFDEKLSKLLGSGANSNGESSVFEQIPIGETCWKASNEMNFRKRKAISRGKMKADGSISYKGVAGDEDASAKRSKPTESRKNENGGSDNETEKQKYDQKPLKDYIHVRARRGQATDSHSLAERVRREKISERMKLLQDLVPGCNKVIGKAVMLDEIINYVESLQRQVEFLSMKLASVNPGLAFDMENLIFKNTFRQSANTPQEMYPLDSSAAAFYNHRSNNTNVSNEPLSQSSVDPIPLDAPLCHNSGVQLSSVHGFSESLPQFSAFCEDDLHTIVQMGFGQNLVNFPVENQTSNKGAER